MSKSTENKKELGKQAVKSFWQRLNKGYTEKDSESSVIEMFVPVSQLEGLMP